MEREETGTGGVELLDKGELRVTMVGHASVLMELGGLKIVTDPVYKEHVFEDLWYGGFVEMLSWFPFVSDLYRRQIEPGVDLWAVRPDIVLLSHGDPDHKDEELLRHYGENGALIIAPLGLVERKNIIGINQDLPGFKRGERYGLKALDSFNKIEGIRITAVPVQHGSKEALGYVIEAEGKTIYYVGDGGYDQDSLEKVARRWSEIDVVFWPIGESRDWLSWFVPMLWPGKVSRAVEERLERKTREKRSKLHAGPEDVPAVVEALGLRKNGGILVPTHFGMYNMGGNRSLIEPEELMREIIPRAGLEKIVRILSPGEQLS